MFTQFASHLLRSVQLAAYNTEKICEVVISKQRYGTELFNPSIKRKNLAKIFINSLLKIVVGIDGGIFLCLNTVFSRTVETLLEWFDDIQAVFTVEGAEDFKNECMGLIDWLIAKKNESKATEEVSERSERAFGEKRAYLR